MPIKSHAHNGEGECVVCGLVFAHEHEDVTKPKELTQADMPDTKGWEERFDELFYRAESRGLQKSGIKASTLAKDIKSFIVAEIAAAEKRGAERVMEATEVNGLQECDAVVNKGTGLNCKSCWSCGIRSANEAARRAAGIE